MSGAPAWSSELRQTVERVLPGATAGDSGAGELYRVLPSARRARVLVPATDRRAATVALRGYGRLQPRCRGALRRAAAPALARSMDHLPAADLVSAPSADGLRRHLEDVLGAGDLSLAVPVRSLDPHSKPTAQVLDAAGRTVGFCKVGSGPGAERLRTEVAGLRRLARRSATRVRVPAVLYEGCWRQRQLVLTEPVPPHARRLRAVDLPLTWPLLHELQSDAVWGTLSSGGWLDDARTRVTRVVGSLEEQLSEALDVIQQRHGDTEVLMGESHGDWTPWNLATTRGQVWCWDLEHSTAAAPFGLDVVQGCVLVEQHVRRRSFEDACAAAAVSAAQALPALGLSTRTTAAVLAVSLWDLVARACEVRGTGQSPDRGWQTGHSPGTLETVLRRAVQPDVEVWS